MRFSLDQIKEEPASWTEKVQATELLERVEVSRVTPIRVEGSVQFVDPDYLLRAQLEYEQTLVCDRCLEEFPDEITERVELMVVRQVAGGAPLELETELEEDDLSVVICREEELDTAPILEEQLQLNVPMKPLCREDCAGLCPDCGVNRNNGTCECQREEVDPRWAALAKLKSGSDSS